MAALVNRDDVLAAGRVAAEAGMLDTCVIRRRTGEASDEWGAVAETWTQLYSGKCRVQHRDVQAQEEIAGEARLLMVRLEVHLPMSVVGLEPEDEVLITASRSDPDLPGRVFTIRDLAHGTEKTARRIGVVERTS
ncbi:DUF6093 family protein [Actinoplanes siamensis]|uniref:Uncharacterized protein n=1 Tax=Actinoplanes siamensis TaxID=1223317 RepID=A0A919TMS5_9ACTN|nr:DUF6093 family protein [Actinoplanes siamensis]GIF08661.1 hypothetical protein Asi03nite_61990 [Actinoplanes siamensis]